MRRLFGPTDTPTKSRDLTSVGLLRHRRQSPFALAHTP